MLKKEQILLSGARPTGNLHLGHYVGAFKRFVNLHMQYQSYFIISDLHMLTTKCLKKEIETIERNTVDMIIDSIAMGVNPSDTTFYLQSNIPELTYISTLFQNYIDYNRAISTPSFIEMKKHTSSDTASLGLVAYPVMEAGDIFALKANLVPVGKDNIDHIIIAQEIISRINSEFGTSFIIPEYITDERTNYLVGIDGTEKMSKSLNNSIYIRDNKDDVWKKILRMPWSISNIKTNVVSTYLGIFCPNFFDTKKMESDILGGMLTEKQAREALCESIAELLDEMQLRVSHYLQDDSEIRKMLAEGTMKVREIVIAQLNKLKTALGLYQVRG